MTDYRGLPKEYTQVEYIESTGTQYIDTGFVPNSNTRVVMNVMLVKQTAASKAIFGARSKSSGKDSGSFTFLSIETGAKTRSDYFGSSVTGNFPILGKRVVIDRDKNVCNIDGNVITNKTSANKCSVNMYLFAVNTANSALLQSNLKLYSCQIYDNGTLKLDFVPAKRVSDNVIGMYDMVSKTFFMNAGTSVFTAGAEVKERVAAYVGIEDALIPTYTARKITNAYVGVFDVNANKSVARKIKKAYIGVPKTELVNRDGFSVYFDPIDSDGMAEWVNYNDTLDALQFTSISAATDAMNEFVSRNDLSVSFNWFFENRAPAMTNIVDFFINGALITSSETVTGGNSKNGIWTGRIQNRQKLKIELLRRIDSHSVGITSRIPDTIQLTVYNIQISMPSVARLCYKATPPQ